jgi:hypothetical protein
MNLSLAFFHGEQALVALILAGVIVVVSVPLVFYVWFRHTQSSELKLTYIYVISTAVVCLLMALTTNDEMSEFHLTLATIAGILTLPWNFITLLAVNFAGNSEIGNREIISAMLLGAGVNAMILRFLGKKAKGWR